jgi:hypothetical protein
LKPDTSRTVLFAPFAGQDRRFRLTIGKIADLERICEAGIGGIMMRVGTHQFKACDIWDTIRLALEGGGMSEPQATAMCMAYHDEPLIWHAELAARILTAAVSGVPIEKINEAEYLRVLSEEQMAGRA